MMVNHSADECGRVVRAQRCRCGEMPQVQCHTGRCASWFSCDCGKISQESKEIARAIAGWNSLNTWGETE